MIQRLNQLPAWLPILILLAVHYWTNELTTNEEHYLLLAKLFYQPDWLGHPEFNRGGEINRWIYQYFAGGLLQITTFPIAALLGRIFLSLLFALTLGKLIRLLQLSNLEGLFALTLFFIAKQNFFAGSWMLLSFEAKGLAYPLILWSVIATMTKRPYQTVVAAAVATWCHILVGGWFILVWAIYHFWEQWQIKAKWKQVFFPLFLYGILVSPLVLLLLQNMAGEPSIINGVNINYLYTYGRNAHHTAPFANQWHFNEFWRAGLLYLIVLSIINYRFIRPLDLPVIKRLSTLSLLMAIPLILAFGIAYFDSTGALLKFYPFRQNTLLKLLLILLFAAVLKQVIIPKRYYYALNFSFLLLLLVAWVRPAHHNLQSWQHKGTIERNLTELATYIQSNTPAAAVFLYYNEQKGSAADPPYFFNRSTRRRNFITHKFAPLGNQALYNWHERVKERDKLVGNLNYLFELRKTYQLDYLITRWEVPRPGLKLLFDNDYYYLYKIETR